MQTKFLDGRVFGFLALMALLVAGCGGGSSDDSGSATTGAGGPQAAGGAPGGGPGKGASGGGASAPITSTAGIDLSAIQKVVKGFALTSESGYETKATTSVDPNQTKAIVEAKAPGVSRSDPFSLLSVEKKYDRLQQGVFAVTAAGTFAVYYKPEPEPPVEPDIAEPAPPGLRLSGIVLHNGVGALIEIGGRTEEIHPGSVLGGEWVVVSIDSEKALLRRNNKKKPHEIVVPLAGRIGGPPDSGGAGGNGSGDSGAGGAPSSGSAPGGAAGRGD